MGRPLLRHLAKLVDAWNDVRYRDFTLSYVGDEEQPELDFVTTESRRDFTLIEAKLGADRPSASLRCFREGLAAKPAIPVSRPDTPRRATEPLAVPADRFLARV